MKRFHPAYIDMSITCMHCNQTLWNGAYHKGIIGKINKKIKKNKWIHHPTEGTLCEECAKPYLEDEK